MSNRSGNKPESVLYGMPARLSWVQKALSWVFIGAGFWYLTWRPSAFNWDAPVFSSVVYGAEVFGFVCALLHIYMCWRLSERTPLPVPADATVAVFIPTINESVDMVRRTVMAAQRMKGATQVWLLDDGNRLEMQALAEEIGCRYLARTENTEAKAGNLNHALRYTDCDYVAIFDADHAPAHDFLEETLGFFRDEKVAFVQTPQDFYNLDSFQHRLDLRRARVWSEQTLFFRVIQAGKDRLGAAFFCGSCAVVRREALEQVGGFATGTVTEDIHTSLRLHKLGWKSVYYPRPLAFGLAPSTAIPFLKQRLRWGQGAMQVWRREGILTARGLTLSQRLSYLATVLAYFEGWQRLILFLAPVVVLTTGTMPLLQVDGEFLKRFIPYYALTFLVFEEVSRGHGRILLTEQYNMMRFAVFITATFGFFLKKLRFVVTPKEIGARDATRRSLWPQYAVLAVNAVAIPAGLLGLADGLPPLALWANIAWATVISLVALFAIRYAVRASSSRRREYRFPLPVAAQLSDGDAQNQVALVTDISPTGCRITGPNLDGFVPGQTVAGTLLLPTGPLPFAADVKAVIANRDAQPSFGCEFLWGEVEERTQLETFLFGSDLQWRVNDLSERVPTPLERLARMLRGSPRIPETRVDGQTWAPILVKRVNQESLSGVGFISASDPSTGARSVLSLDVLPRNGHVFGEEVTPVGRRGVVGRITDETVFETHAASIYMYKLTA